MVVELPVTALAIKSRSASRASTRGGGDRAPRGIQPEQVDDDRHRERCNADAANDQDPGAVVDDGRVPGPLQVASEDPAASQGHQHADRAGDRTGDRRRPEHANGNELFALELLWILRADDQDVGEEEHHRQAPDHRDRCLQGDVDSDRDVGVTAEEKVGDRRDDRGDHRLNQYSILRHFVAVDTADEGRQPAVEATDEEQAGEGVVVDGGVEDEEGDHHQRYDPGQEGAERSLDRAQDGRGRVDALHWYGDHGAERQHQVADHDHDRAPDQVAGDRLAVTDFHPHIQGHLDAEQGEDHETIEGGVPGVEAERTPREVVGRGMAAQQPGEAGEADREDGGAVDDEDTVYQVLCDAEAEDR